MKTYQKAEMIAKNLPTGSYAAGCPTHHKEGSNVVVDGSNFGSPTFCYKCEIAG